MTKGPILRELIIFSLPLLLGNVFQQLYSTVDSVVVGRFVGADAFGAVTSNLPAIASVVGLFIGFATGSSVLVSQYFGAGDVENLRKAVHTSVVSTVFLGIIMSMAGVFAAPYIVRAMRSPPEIAPLASTYLSIYFSGLIFSMLYNIGVGILRAVGDSRRPLYFLIFSSIVNVVLDLVFVIKFGLGVAGVAYATVIAQFLTAILTYFVLFRSREIYGIRRKELKFDLHIFRRIVSIGLPSGFQIALTSFSNIFVQGYINSFGNSVTSGWGAYHRIASLIILPVQSLGLAVTTFTGQNAGAGRYDRIKKSEKISLSISLLITILLSAAIWFSAPMLVTVFNSEPMVIKYGTFFLRHISPLDFIFCFYMIYSGILRGLGDTKKPTMIMLSGFVVFRQLFLFIARRITDSIYPVTFAYPVGWIACSAGISIYYFRRRRNFPGIEPAEDF